MNEERIQNLEIEKIIVSPEDELIDVLKQIEQSKANHIILTFAENTDLLISPITLKVLQDSADEKGKPMVCLIIQNPVGVRNAKEAGMTITETSGSIVDTFWEMARSSMEERLQEKKSKLKRTYSTGLTKNEEVVNTENAFMPEDIEVNQKLDTASKSEFQKRVEEAIEKSRHDIDNKKKVISENGITLALDQDLDDLVNPNAKQSMVGKNFKDTPEEKPIKGKGKGLDFKFTFPKLNLPKIGGGLWLKILVPVILILSIVGFAVYTYLPTVKVKIFVQSKNVSIDKVFTGSTKTLEFSSEKGTVPVKKESSEKTASNSTKATGTGYKGTKAEGIIVVKYYDIIGNPAGVTLKAGTVVTSSGGLKYETTASAIIKNFINDPIPVKALAVGEEYNVASGQLFTVAGYTGTQMDASNSDPFEGGSKTPYVILSKSDVDKVVKDLQKNLTNEAENELKDKNDETWEIIEKSIQTSLDGNPQTDVPIGAEADTVNVTIKVKSSGLFYQKNMIDSSINSLLTKSANDQNLFENTTKDLSLDESLTKSIEVTEIKKDVIKVSVKASANIQPKIDKDNLATQLSGKSWKEGMSILNTIKYTQKDNEVVFEPTYFPDWIKYFPQNKGKIYITIQELKP